MYITNLGDQVTVEQIAEAVKAGRALLVNRYAGPPALTTYATRQKQTSWSTYD